MTYVCHSYKAPNNRQHVYVQNGNGLATWTYKFTRSCQYDNKANDIKCNGCKHEHKDDVSE